MKFRTHVLPLVVATAALAGCGRDGGDLVISQGVGITAVLTTCPAVGIPDYTGDVTTFTGDQPIASALAVS
ncbi:MAG: hypothetical protein HRT64_13835, partial [Erythrobacter sp.]|nr:hypothetical protein [Erythrobacter sp.]